jgi:hypothetical protein
MINNQITQTPISPQAMSNQGTIKNMFGQAMPGTFNRTLDLAQSQVPTDPLTGQVPDPTLDQSTNYPVPPPMGVQSSITPPYGLN